MGAAPIVVSQKNGGDFPSLDDITSRATIRYERRNEHGRGIGLACFDGHIRSSDGIAGAFLSEVTGLSLVFAGRSRSLRSSHV